MRGFTLIELLVVLAIVAVAAMIATPSYIQFIKQDRIISHANQLHSVFKFARSEAVKQERSIDLRINGTQWEVVANQGLNNERVLRKFVQEHSALAIALSAQHISMTGELNRSSVLTIRDDDANTTDYQLCILRSGQSWLVTEQEGCA